jgi:hypothetical protein
VSTGPGISLSPPVVPHTTLNTLTQNMEGKLSASVAVDRVSKRHRLVLDLSAAILKDRSGGFGSGRFSRSGRDIPPEQTTVASDIGNLLDARLF